MSKSIDNIQKLNMSLRTKDEINYVNSLNDLLSNSNLTPYEQLTNFPLYTPRQNIATFLAKYELFKKIKNVHWLSC